MDGVMKEHLGAHKAEFRIEDVYPISIPDTVSIERIPPKSILDVYSGRLDRFDYKMLFYDVFLAQDGKCIRLSGPPLANLTEYVKGSSFSVDGEDVTHKVQLIDLLRKQDSKIEHGTGQYLTLSCPHFASETKISRSEANIFNNKNVLLGINKNNSLVWITDWASFYAEAHKVDAVLLYDTGSTAYTSQELLSALQSVKGIDAVVIVRWPFRHGPFREKPGVDANANYSQVVMLSHAKEKYLAYARSVIHCDIDELIYSYRGASICDAAVESTLGVILVPGTWVESVTSTTSQSYRHLDFRHVDPKRGPSLTKWAIAPSKLPKGNNWQVHGVWAVDGVETTQQFHFAHFRGISTNWRETRAVYETPQAHHEVFTDIENFIEPYLIGKPSYHTPQQQPKGIDMAIVQERTTPAPASPASKTESSEIKPSLDAGGLAALTEHLSKCESYLEYGCGGSTVLAAKSGVKRIIAVDTAQAWLETVEKNIRGFSVDITLKHCDLGPVRTWGYPIDKQHIGRFHKYAILPWDIAKASGTTPQVIFIDGRFRVACFLYSLMAAKLGTIILFDDYMNRPPYHEVEKFCQRTEARGRMGVFVVKEKPPMLEVMEAFAKYSVVEY